MLVAITQMYDAREAAVASFGAAPQSEICRKPEISTILGQPATWNEDLLSVNETRWK